MPRRLRGGALLRVYIMSLSGCTRGLIYRHKCANVCSWRRKNKSPRELAKKKNKTDDAPGFCERRWLYVQ